MLNFSNLAFTIMLTMGMASNTMPFNHEEKAPLNTTEITTLENDTATSNPYINNYEMQLNARNTIHETINLLNYKEDAYRDSLRNSNNYLNVIGNIYTSNVYSMIDNSISEYQNLYTLNGNYDLVDDYASRRSMILKITPYNYNINNEIHISIRNTIEQGVILGDYLTYITDFKMIRTLYQTTEDLDQFIDMQLTATIGARIKNEITNINNGFFYSKDQTELQKSGVYYNDTLEITLTPNVSTYIFVDYIPMVSAMEYDETNLELPGEVITAALVNVDETSFWFEGTIDITGTNIIPSGNYEVIDIPSLMWEILTMPFAFVSQAFNLTLFPGTPYQLNIANLFLSIIAILVFVWLIQFFLKMKG